MASILITGANRGIGLGMVKRILIEEKPFNIVIGTYRDEKNSKELIEMKAKHSKLYILKLDVTEYEAFKEFASSVKKIVGSKGLTVLFNNAGVTLKNKYGNFKTITPDEYLDVFYVNAVAPMFLVQALLPLLVTGAKKGSSVQSAIVNVSSVLGSIRENDSGSFWAFRESKASLNQLTRNLAKEKDIIGYGIISISIYPGHVRTNMGGHLGKLSVEESTNAMYYIITTMTAEMNDKFIQWDGIEIPW